MNSPSIMNVCSTEKRLHNYIHVLRCAHVRKATIYAKLDTPVGCVPSACQQHVFWWPPLDVSTGRGWYTFPMMYTHPSLQAQVGVGGCITIPRGIPTPPRGRKDRQTPMKTLPSRNYCCGQ